MSSLIYWDIYEVTAPDYIQGVMLRGRIRKFALQKSMNLLTDNATDTENTVRFAIEYQNDPTEVIEFIKTLVDTAKVGLIQEKVPNPVLSKMKVNNEERYSI